MNSPVLKRCGVMTWTLVALSCLLTLLTSFGENQAMLSHFVFWPPAIREGEIWRVLTPIFLHFSIFGSLFMHLLFNMLWLIVFGGLIEKEDGILPYGVLVLLAGVIGNTASFYFYGPLFGGMSGVCFGVISYVWLRGFVKPAFRREMPHSLMIIFAVFLLLGYTGLIGNVANAAHTAGYLCGLLVAAPATFLSDSRGTR